MKAIRFADTRETPDYAFMELKSVDIMVKAKLAARASGRPIEIVKCCPACEVPLSVNRFDDSILICLNTRCQD